MALFKLTESQKLWHFNIVLIMVFGILLIAKLNPTSETFTCNENKVCTLKQTYILPPLNTTKTYKLNLGCCLEPIEYRHSNKSKTWYEYRIGFDNRDGKASKLFKAISARTNNERHPNESIYDYVFQNEIKLFEKYKKEPTRGFVLKSPAEPGDFAFWLYAWVFLMTGLMIWNFFDKNKG